MLKADPPARGFGASNPWGLAWSADGAILVVTYSGTHEVSIIDFPALLKRLLDLPAPLDPLIAAYPATPTSEEVELASYLHYFPSSRLRVKLPEGDLGPRAVAVVGHTAYTANYFSDNRHDRHGKTSDLTSQEIDDLCAYLLLL